MSQRTERVDELLRQEIGALLAKEIADPRIGFATITDVETSPDLRHAKVWVSVIGGKADRDETLRAMQQSMGYVRHELGRRLRIRRIPELHVRLDDSAERGTRLLHLLNELEAGADPQAIEPFTDSLPTPVRRLPHEGDTDDPADAAAADAPKRPPQRRGAPSRPRREPVVEGPSDQAGQRRVRLGQVAATASPAASPDPASPALAEDDRRPSTSWRSPPQRSPTRWSLACGARARCSPSATRTPTRTRSARRSRCAAWSRPSAGARPRCSRTSRPPIYAFMPDVERVRAGSGSRRRLRPAGPVRLRDGRARRRGRRTAPGAVPRSAAGDHRPPRLQRRPGAGGLGRPRCRRDVRDDRAARGPARGAARRRRRRPGDGADGRDRHGHRDLRPPQRDAAHARRVRGARGGRRTPVRHLATALPVEAQRAAGAVRAGAGAHPDVARRTDHLVHARTR